MVLIDIPIVLGLAIIREPLCQIVLALVAHMRSNLYSCIGAEGIKARKQGYIATVNGIH